jgi:hypothetical protein
MDSMQEQGVFKAAIRSPIKLSYLKSKIGYWNMVHTSAFPFLFICRRCICAILLTAPDIVFCTYWLNPRARGTYAKTVSQLLLHTKPSFASLQRARYHYLPTTQRGCITSHLFHWDVSISWHKAETLTNFRNYKREPLQVQYSLITTLCFTHRYQGTQKWDQNNIHIDRVDVTILALVSWPRGQPPVFISIL